MGTTRASEWPRVAGCGGVGIGTIVGVGYNLAQALLGGTAPLLATAAYGLGGSAVWTGVYFACVAALAGICLCVDARDKRTRGYQLQASSADDSPEPSRP